VRDVLAGRVREHAGGVDERAAEYRPRPGRVGRGEQELVRLKGVGVIGPECVPGAVLDAVPLIRAERAGAVVVFEVRLDGPRRGGPQGQLADRDQHGRGDREPGRKLQSGAAPGGSGGGLIEIAHSSPDTRIPPSASTPGGYNIPACPTLHSKRHISRPTTGSKTPPADRLSSGSAR